MEKHPILYSFRRCPYAIRARLGLKAAQIECELREVVLRDKPASMLELSSKGTVPVLLLPDNTVIDESIDVMHWALQQSDPLNWSDEAISLSDHNKLIEWNDGEFKEALDRYKYFDRHPEKDQDGYLQEALPFLEELEQRLNKTKFLSGEHFGMSDASILPFIRQFCMSDQNKFAALPLSKLQAWLKQQLESDLFLSVMKKYPQWQIGDSVTLFPQKSA